MNILDKVRARAFDLIHNVDTVKRVPIAALTVAGNNKAAGHQYFPTLPKSFDALLGKLRGVGFEDKTFIDIGSGKGLTLLIAARHPFCRIIGVEFSVELCAIARSNFESYRGRLSSAASRSEIICEDAATFAFPDEPMIVYFFNPFSDVIMRQVLLNLRRSFEQASRSVIVICDKLHNRALFQEILQPSKQTEVIGFAVYWME